MDKAAVFSLILKGLAKAPEVIDALKHTAHSNDTKREKAFEVTHTALETLDAIAPEVRQNPRFQELERRANDAIYELAKYGQLLADKRTVN